MTISAKGMTHLNSSFPTFKSNWSLQGHIHGYRGASIDPCNHPVPVVKEVVFNTVVDVWDLADVKPSSFHLLEVLLQFCPAIHHQLQSLVVI